MGSKILYRFTIVCFLMQSCASARIIMPVLFHDSMVLQQKVPVKIFGDASAGASITVDFCGVKKTTTALNGEWVITLDAMPAGGPYELMITGDGEEIVYRDIMLGEVWLASGQSNMAFQVQSLIDFEQFLPEKEDPQLRFIQIPVTEFGDINRNGLAWQKFDPKSVKEFSAVAYFFATELQKRLGVTVGVIGSYRGATWNENWMTPESIKNESVIKYLFEDYEKAYAKFEDEAAYEAAYQQYLVDLKAWEAKGGWSHGVVPFAPLGPKAYQRPSGLYNCMIKPLQPYNIKGCIWYQGEGNAGRHEEFRTLFPAFVQGWRKAWRQPDMPFYFVQLPPYRAASWPHFRQAQLDCAKMINHCGMIVSQGCGNEEDIHPRVKKPIGDRLAIAVSAEVYGQRHIPYGPMFESVALEAGKAFVKFDYSGSGLMLSAPDKGSFEIAGDDGVFKRAEVALADDELILWCDDIEHPKFVRYAYKPNPDMILFNKEGLPASPFTSEKMGDR